MDPNSQTEMSSRFGVEASVKLSTQADSPRRQAQSMASMSTQCQADARTAVQPFWDSTGLS